jgi:hypothetical protein
MQNSMKAETASLVVDRGTKTSDVTVSAVLQTDVTSSQEGSWTLSNRFTEVEAKVNGEDRPDASGLPVDKLTGTGTGKTSAVYDTEKARFISNKSNVVMETTGKVIMGEKSEPVKNTFTSFTQIELVNR